MTWTKDEIRDAREAILAPLLIEQGYNLHKQSDGNFRMEELTDLVVKENYWVWPSKKINGQRHRLFHSGRRKNFR